MRRSGIIIALAIAALIATLTWAVLNNHNAADTAISRATVARHIAVRVHEAQVQTCHEVGDPLIRGQIALWQEQIDSTHNIKSSDLPGFGPKRFHQLIRRQRRGAQKHIHTLRAAPSCEERFD